MKFSSSRRNENRLIPLRIKLTYITMNLINVLVSSQKYVHVVPLRLR